MRSDFTPYNTEPPPELHPNFFEWRARNLAEQDAKNAALKQALLGPISMEENPLITEAGLSAALSGPTMGITRLGKEAAKDAPKIMEALQAKLGAGPGTDISTMLNLSRGADMRMSVPSGLDRVSKNIVENTPRPYGRETLADLMSSDRELVNGKPLGDPISPPQKMNRPFLFPNPETREKALDMRIKVAENLGASPYDVRAARKAGVDDEYGIPTSIVKTWHRGDTRLPRNVREEIETNWKPQAEFDSGLTYLDERNSSGSITRSVMGPNGEFFGRVSFDPVYGGDLENLFTPGLASLRSSTWGSGIGTKVYSDFEKDFGVKIVPNNAQSIRAQNLWLRKGYGRDFGVPLSEGSPYSFWDNSSAAYRLSKKLGQLPARKKLPEYQPPKEFLNEPTSPADLDRMIDELARLRGFGPPSPPPPPPSTPPRNRLSMNPKLQNAIDSIRQWVRPRKGD